MACHPDPKPLTPAEIEQVREIIRERRATPDETDDECVDTLTIPAALTALPVCMLLIATASVREWWLGRRARGGFVNLHNGANA